MPKSPSSTAAPVEVNTSRQCGPSSAPKSRYVRIGVTLSTRASGAATEAQPRKTSISWPIESMTAFSMVEVAEMALRERPSTPPSVTSSSTVITSRSSMESPLSSF